MTQRELRDWEQPYDVDHHCETCNTKRRGTEYPVAGFLIVCHYCSNPPVLVGLYRRMKVKIRFNYGKIKYVLTTTAEERTKRRAYFEKKKAEINARRAAEGRPLIGETLKKLTS